jgi:hypothetical protein
VVRIIEWDTWGLENPCKMFKVKQYFGKTWKHKKTPTQTTNEKSAR